MLNRLAFTAAMTVLISAPQLVMADPITYDFSGTLSQPADGVTTFSGSLTFNATPAGADVSPGGAYVVESGSEVSLSLSLGGQHSTSQRTRHTPPSGCPWRNCRGTLTNPLSPWFSSRCSHPVANLGFGCNFVSPATNIPTNLATLAFPVHLFGGHRYE